MSEQKPKASRQAFGEALAELGAKHTDLVVLDADLAKSTKSELFAKKFPERFFEMGIAEQNMVGVAAGLGLAGKNAFCCSFACFVAGRFETIKISVAYSGGNVKIVGTHAGVGIGPDGYSQMGLEDLALMRTLPTMEVYQPADELETRQIVEYLATHRGAGYLRLTRQDLTPVHGPAYKFVPGKLDVLAEGKDVAILATGGPTFHAVDARKKLAAVGIDAAVINVPSIKPFDRDGIATWATKVPLFVSVEDHNVLGGMGGAVAEVLAEVAGARARLHRHGIPDVFGESGEPEDLYRKFKLDADGIVAVVREQLGR
ncbi:transketolase family protein [Sandaracinus amylolyticus]|uniref:transketolase family protein n=1 Tax=Sandaracinus amylolyticus TaxID=927083 RepID=UPI001F273471|nr:transketolase C-terminal domain-containing protein [Sandaracinus amylolyticus]UJR78650.1 Transketolase C-terminal section [Sandaracinus amylolyticus]